MALISHLWHRSGEMGR